LDTDSLATAMSVRLTVFAVDADHVQGDALFTAERLTRARTTSIIATRLEEWLERAENELTSEDLAAGVSRTIELLVEEDTDPA